MRINRESLLKLARETVNQRSRKDRTILAAYLSGALLGEEYLLGGAGDIDLTFIHIDRVEPEREIVRLTDEVHLDIAHHAQKEYMQTRRLRIHPWLGPTIFNCQILYDPQHIMDFTQASVRGQFDRPDYVLGRAFKLVQHARQMWTGLTVSPPETDHEKVQLYLQAIEHAANGIAVVTGMPLTERRLLMDFPSRAEALERGGLYAGLLGLMGGQSVDGDLVRSWLPTWELTLDELPEDGRPASLNPNRRMYYLKAFEALLSKEDPRVVLWPLLHSWTLAVCSLKKAPPEWQNAFTKLNLIGEGFERKLDALDAYLDLVEETLDDWGQRNGVSI